MEVYEVSTSSKKTKSVYVSTVISIALVLLMTGLLGLILIHANKLSEYVKENIVLNIILDESVEEERALAFQKRVNGNAAVLQSEYVSKDSAATKLTAELGEDFITFLGHNPLSASIDVYLKSDYANTDSVNAFIETISADSQVSEIIYQESLIEMINQNIRIIGLIILAFAIILLIIAVALINNTIRLAIYSQRFIIKSMQLVGATPAFIRKPFLGYGALHGFIGSLIAIGLLLSTIYFAQREIPELVALKDWSQFILVFIGVMVLGILISVFSTYFSVSKYLKLRSNELYR